MAQRLRILVIHNYYKQPGGEDKVFASETRLLEAHGHEVIRYTTHNDQVGLHGPVDLAMRTIWNGDTYRELGGIIRARRPHVMHAHNTFPLISAAAYSAAREGGVPIVQTVHNFRLACANGLMFRQGRICEDCVGRRIAWPAVLHKCYRGSMAASAVVATMLLHRRLRETWHHDVDVFVALSEFARRKLIEGGLPADKCVVKPNFVDSELHVPSANQAVRGDYFLFVGRLAEEKGIRTLLAAWNDVADLPPLLIAGDGPLKAEVARAAAANRNVEWLGRQSARDLWGLLSQTQALVVPSEWYEMCPLVVLEAFAVGRPVIGTRLGGLESIVDAGRTGLLFRAGDHRDLGDKVRWAAKNRAAISAMGRNARLKYLESYTPDVNYHALRAVYARAMNKAGIA